MRYAVKLYSQVANPEGIPGGWPAEVLLLSDSDLLPEGYTEMTSDQVVAQKTTNLTAYNTWFTAKRIGQLQQQGLESIINSAFDFYEKLRLEFIAENIALGIVQAGQTNRVRKILFQATDALRSSSPIDSIREITLIDPNDFDDIFITPDRLLRFRNKIEVFLGRTLATRWDDPV